MLPQPLIARNKRRQETEPLWLIAYLDLMTNLLAIFIFIVSISTISKSKYEVVTKGVTDNKTETLADLKKQLDAIIEKDHLQDLVRTSLDLDGLKVIFTSSSLFQSGSSDILKHAVQRSLPLLSAISKADKRYQMNFEGYTDDVTIKRGSRYVDNWALSSDRGLSLLNQMVKLGVNNNRLSVAGYADTKPAVSIQGKTGQSLEKARAANRRVVIRVFL